MLGTYRSAFAILPLAQKKKFIWIALLGLVVAAVDALGLASLVPLITLLADPQFSSYLIESDIEYLAFIDMDLRSFFGILFLCFFSLSLLVRAAYLKIQLTFVGEIEAVLSTLLFEKYLRRSYLWLLDQNAGTIGASLLAEVASLVNQGILPLMSILSHSVIAGGILLFLVTLDPAASGIIAVILFSFYACLHLLTSDFYRDLGVQSVELNQGRFNRAIQIFRFVKLIKLRGIEQDHVSEFGVLSHRFCDVRAKTSFFSQAPKYVFEGVAAIALGAALIFLLEVKGESAAGALALLGVYVLAGYRILPSAQQIYQSVANMKFASVIINKFERDLADESYIEERSSSSISGGLSMDESLELKNVSFAYKDGDGFSIKNLNLRIEKGKTYGFVGKTGSGKSTIIDLLAGLLKPVAGQILLDGRVLKPREYADIRNIFGYVPQDLSLMDESIGENIVFGEKKWGRGQHKRLTEVVKLAHLDDVIRAHPKGFDVRCGDSGARLSGGQRQRICLARALYPDPQILLLDEVTSALDGSTERQITNSLANLRGEKTIVFITHRLNTVKNCDQIFVISDGSVVASGEFDELMSGNQLFKDFLPG